MKLEKAIEINKDLLTTSPQFSPDERRDAVKLGIEALKERQLARDGGIYNLDLPLLGETEA